MPQEYDTQSSEGLTIIWHKGGTEAIAIVPKGPEHDRIVGLITSGAAAGAPSTTSLIAEVNRLRQNAEHAAAALAKLVDEIAEGLDDGEANAFDAIVDCLRAGSA